MRGDTKSENSVLGPCVAEKPLAHMLDPTRHGDATRDFEAVLRSRIVGQDAAVQAVTEMYRGGRVRGDAPHPRRILYVGTEDHVGSPVDAYSPRGQ